MNWELSDAIKLKEFLNTETGKKLKVIVEDNAPPLTVPGDTLEDRAMHAVAYSQWQEDKKTIKKLTSINPEGETETPYIDLKPLEVE